MGRAKRKHQAIDTAGFANVFGRTRGTSHPDSGIFALDHTQDDSRIEFEHLLKQLDDLNLELALKCLAREPGKIESRLNAHRIFLEVANILALQAQKEDADGRALLDTLGLKSCQTQDIFVHVRQSPPLLHIQEDGQVLCSVINEQDRRPAQRGSWVAAAGDETLPQPCPQCSELAATPEIFEWPHYDHFDDSEYELHLKSTHTKMVTDELLASMQQQGDVSSTQALALAKSVFSAAIVETLVEYTDNKGYEAALQMLGQSNMDKLLQELRDKYPQEDETSHRLRFNKIFTAQEYHALAKHVSRLTDMKNWMQTMNIPTSVRADRLQSHQRARMESMRILQRHLGLTVLPAYHG
jgi:hypothetical protein